jgi:arylsulfatase
VWELYHVAEDFSECHDLAEQEPERLARLVELWWEEARRYQVLPLDNRPIAALLAPRRPFDVRDRYVFYPNGAPVPENVTVNVRNRNHTVTAHVELPDGPAEGVLLAIGTALGGWSFHLVEGRLEYVHNYVGKARYTVSSDVVVAPGEHELTLSFHSNGDFSGVARLLVDGRDVGGGPITTTTPVRYSISGAGLTCGWEQGPPVGEGYEVPFRFTGTLQRVVVEVDGVGHRDPEAEFEAIMAEQ